MGKIREQFKNLPLKTAFRYLVIIMVGAVLLLSAVSILGCWYAQKIILPESQTAYLFVNITYTDGSTENFKQRINYEKQIPLGRLEADGQEKKAVQDTSYTVEPIENSMDDLSPKRKMAYYTLGSLMILLPMLYSIIGVSLCAWFFYKKKLEQPLKILSEAAENIRKHDLDFTVTYNSQDEMGNLSKAFEQMRAALYQNNQELWEMVRDEKELQASLAHDLRNPIAVLKGYAEYLQQCIKNGNLDENRVSDISENLIAATLRMEQYTDSVKQLHNIEELEIHKENVRLSEYLHDMAQDFEIVAIEYQKEFLAVIPETEEEIAVDSPVFSRIVENVFMNALRFARNRITMESCLCGSELMLCITDDGNGFRDDILEEIKQKNSKVQINQHRKYKFDLSGEHMGMGLVIGKILAGKHGGDIKIENISSGGARVTVVINIRR